MNNIERNNKNYLFVIFPEHIGGSDIFWLRLGSLDKVSFQIGALDIEQSVRHLTLHEPVINVDVKKFILKRKSKVILY